ncbi:MAG: ATP-binding cassette domain-containing protein, partial [Allorhizobium sp.]
MLVNGKWTEDWQPVQKADEKGRFVRQTSSFRHWITPDGSAGPTGEGGFPAEAGRYRLYVGYICPWASRTLMARALKGLEDVIAVTVVAPALSSQGWQFGGYPGADADPLFGATYLHELYTRADPDFTGRENIFMNGAIHGLSDKQVRERLDAIIDFAEIEDFIDMPVRTYSSGMQLRLAFAVAAHVEPDILLLDEVLAVGDEAHDCA